MRFRDECMPLVSYVDTVYYCYNYDLRVAPHNNRNDFPPCSSFLCRIVIPCFLVHPPHPCYKSDKTRVCNGASVSVCALTRTCITCTSTNYVDVPEVPRSRPGAPPLIKCCCVALSCAVIVSLPPRVMRALAASIHVRTYLPKFNKQMHYYYEPTSVPWGFYNNISRTSAVSSTNFGSILIFASCAVGACNILCG